MPGVSGSAAPCLEPFHGHPRCNLKVGRCSPPPRFHSMRSRRAGVSGRSSTPSSCRQVPLSALAIFQPFKRWRAARCRPGTNVRFVCQASSAVCRLSSAVWVTHHGKLVGKAGPCVLDGIGSRRGAGRSRTVACHPAGEASHESRPAGSPACRRRASRCLHAPPFFRHARIMAGSWQSLPAGSLSAGLCFGRLPLLHAVSRPGTGMVPSGGQPVCESVRSKGAHREFSRKKHHVPWR